MLKVTVVVTDSQGGLCSPYTYLTDRTPEQWFEGAITYEVQAGADLSGSDMFNVLTVTHRDHPLWSRQYQIEEI